MEDIKKRREECFFLRLFELEFLTFHLMNRWVSPPLPLYSNQSTLIKGGEWRNILSVRRSLINQDCGVIYSLGRDELGQVWEIYSSDEGRQGTLTLRPSAALTYLLLISSNYFFKCNWKLIEENRWRSAVFNVIQMSIFNRSSTTLSSVKSPDQSNP